MIKKKISYSSETKCKMLGPPQPHCDLTLLVGLRGKREGDGMGKRHLVSRGISLEVITDKYSFFFLIFYFHYRDLEARGRLFP